MAAITVTALTISPLAWTVSRTYLQDELAQVKQAKEWNLPETFKSMDSLSKQLKLDLEARKEFDQLKKEQVSNSQLEKAHKGEIEKLSQQFQSDSEHLKAELNRLTEDLSSVKERLKQYEGETFVLSVGRTHFVVPQVLAIGLISVSGTRKEAEVQFGEVSRTLKPGKFIDTKLDGKVYRVILRDIKNSYSADEATFSVAVATSFEVGE